jgi:hypothetical protein
LPVVVAEKATTLSVTNISRDIPEGILLCTSREYQKYVKRRSRRMNSLSLVSQRRHRVHTHRAPCGQVASQRGDYQQ